MFNRSVNKAILIGNLGKDPELRYMPNGNAVATLTIATTESWKDKQTGERKEKTEWHKLTVFNRLGEMCGEYLKKGAKIYVEGKLQTRKWQGDDGQDRYTTEIVVDEIQMMDASKNNNQTQQDATQGQNNQHPQSAPAQQSWGNAPQADNTGFSLSSVLISQGVTEQAMIAKGWTRAKMVEAGHGAFTPPSQKQTPAHKPQHNGPRHQ